MNFQIGTTYGNYQLIDILDSSRDGVTYKVRNTLTNRLESMRVMPGNTQDDQDRVERFLREIRVHAGLLHPNIVSFYNAAELEGRLVMTSELVDGVALAERLELGPLPWRDAVSLMNQVLSALAYAHERCIVHRDLNPGRIVLTPEGVARLNGFNLAKGLADPHLTALGVVVGSLKYISPEQVKGITQIDGRSDIYSAGVVLYESLTGKPPFQSKSHFELMSAHVNTTPAPPSAIHPSVPRELDAVVLKAMAKDPNERYQTATTFRQALERLVQAPVQPAEAVPEPVVVERPLTPAAKVMAAAAVAQPEAVAAMAVAEPPVVEVAAPVVAEAPPLTVAVPEPAVVERPLTPAAEVIAVAAVAEPPVVKVLAPVVAEAPPLTVAAPEPVVVERPLTPAAEVIAGAAAVAQLEVAATAVAEPPFVEVAAPVVTEAPPLTAAVLELAVMERPLTPAAEVIAVAAVAQPEVAAATALAEPPTVAVPQEPAVEVAAAPVQVEPPPTTEAAPAAPVVEVVAAPVAVEPPPPVEPVSQPAVVAEAPPPAVTAPLVHSSGPETAHQEPAAPRSSTLPDLEMPLFEPIFAPLSAAPVPRELMLAAAFLSLVGIAAFFAFR